MEYKNKVLKALELIKNLDQLSYLENKIRTTSQINRRTKLGREFTRELLILTSEKAQYFIRNGEQPF